MRGYNPPPHISDHPGQLLDAHLAGRGVVGYSGSSWFLFSLFPLSLHVNGGGGRLLDAHPDGLGVVRLFGHGRSKGFGHLYGGGFTHPCLHGTPTAFAVHHNHRTADAVTGQSDRRGSSKEARF